MEWITDNWYLIVTIMAVIVAAASLITQFVSRPNNEQLQALSEWLKFAVTEAEKALGSGTGQLKLRYVWNMAIERFSWLDKVMEFEKFAYYVDEALVWMRQQLERNGKISSYVEGGNADDAGTEELHTDDR